MKLRSFRKLNRVRYFAPVVMTAPKREWSFVDEFFNPCVMG